MVSRHSELLGQFRESVWFTELAEEFRMGQSGVFYLSVYIYSVSIVAGQN